MARRNNNQKKHSQCITISNEQYTIIKGLRRANFEKLEDTLSLAIEGKGSLTIRHSDSEALQRFVQFFKDEIIPKAAEINTKAREAFEKDPESKGVYRPGEEEIMKFRVFLDTALTDFITKSLAAATKHDKAEANKTSVNFNARSSKRAAANDGGKTPQKAGQDTASKIALKDMDYRGPNDGRKQRSQQAAIQDRETDLVFSIGVTGSGKTYTSLFSSLEMLQRGDIEKIYVIRPYVPSGRHRMGDVPGNEAKKLGGLMKGVINNVDKMLAPECDLTFDKLAQKGLIELQPLDKIRSMTFDNCAVIITEAQNVDYDQSDILQRIGENCTFILDGSLEQKDCIVAYPALIDWVLRYADDPLTPFVFYNDEADIIRSPQSMRHLLAHKKAMPEGYVDFRPLTPEHSKNSPLQEAVKQNTLLASDAAHIAAQRTLTAYAARPVSKSSHRDIKLRR